MFFLIRVLTDRPPSLILLAYMQTRSAVRKMVDSTLEQQGTTLPAFIAGHRADGYTIEEAWIELRRVTRVPVALRTLYGWLEREEKKAS